MPATDNPFDNQQFREELSGVFDDKLRPVTELLNKHQTKIDEHEAALNRAKGARWAFHAIWTALVGAITYLCEYFYHSGKGR